MAELMADLILQIVSLDAAPPTQAVMRVFEDDGGTIGRDDTNALALPDKHRRVSRLHATISFPGGTPTITNSSSSLPISIGEQQLDGGESMPIAHGDLIEIGPYLLRANIGALRQSGAASAPAVAVGLNTTSALIPGAILATPLPQAAVAIPASAPPSGDQPIGSDLWPVDRALPAQSSVRQILGSDWPESGGAPIRAFTPDGVSTLGATAISGAAHSQGSAQRDDPFADLLAGISGVPAKNAVNTNGGVNRQAPRELSPDPLAVLGGSTSSQSEVPRGHQNVSAFGNLGAVASLIPNDFNPFDLPSSTARNAADPLAGLAIDSNAGTDRRSLGDALVAAPSIDTLFQSNTHSSTTEGSLFEGTAGAHSVDGTLQGLLGSNTGSDPFALFDSPAPALNPAFKPMRDDAAEIGSAFTPPLARATYWAPPASPPHVEPLVAPRSEPSAAPIPPVGLSIQPMPGTQASPDALSEAFLRGAGLAPSALPHGLTPEIMAIVGSLLRSATAGAVDMLAARAATKREVQASVTIISVQANNPLKFLPNADAALLQLLGKKMPGFMRADVAMRDAFDDLRAHEVGVIAGTRAALTEVLGKFDPAVLGDKLTRGSVLDSLMPSARKAKLWDLYLERYLQIRREAEDDFQSIFGRAFVQAYERETARIKGESPMAGGERG